MVAELARAAAEHGCLVSVMTTNERFKSWLAERAPGTTAIHLDVASRPINPFRDCRDVVRLCRYLRSHRFDLVHTHTSKAGVLGRLAARLASVPAIVHTAHGFAVHERSSHLAIRAFAAAERLAARWCDLVVTVSEFHREWAIRLRLCAPQKVVAIPNGIPDVGSHRAGPAGASPEEAGAAPSATVLCPSRLEPGKGLEDLIEAAARLGEGGAGVRFLVAGEGSLRQDLGCQISSGGAPVQLLGFREDIPALLRQADVVVMPSHREGLSIVLLEALAAGKAIVATAVGGNAEALGFGRAGRLVPVGDPAGLAKAVAELVGDPSERAALGSRARARFEAEYRSEVMSQRYLAAYALVTQPSRRTS